MSRKKRKRYKAVTITPRRMEIRDTIAKFIEDHGRSPGHEELAEILGISRGSVFNHLVDLDSLGLIKYHRRGYNHKDDKITVLNSPVPKDQKIEIPGQTLTRPKPDHCVICGFVQGHDEWCPGD